MVHSIKPILPPNRKNLLRFFENKKFDLQRIIELLNQFSFKVQVEVIQNVDTVLEKLDNVITSDAIILDKCISWINLNA